MKKYLFICCATFFLSACTQKMYTLNPQSHYDYPNSNIKPIANTSGTVSEMAISLKPLGLSGKLERQAISDALGKHSGTDILINYVGEQKRTSLVFIQSVTYTVTGTAAKMEIGKQYLK